MSTDLVTIYNLALGWCRAQAVSDPDEDTPSARLCRRFYPAASLAVLRAYPWNAAAARAILAEVAVPPFGYAHAYRLPDDCVGARRLADDPEAPYAVEGRLILTDLSAPLRLEYTRACDPTDMDPLLARAVAARLAVDIAPTLIESSTTTDALTASYRLILAEARAVDAAEGLRPESVPSEDWTRARR